MMLRMLFVEVCVCSLHAMTHDAQNALRRGMCLFSPCNDS